MSIEYDVLGRQETHLDTLQRSVEYFYNAVGNLETIDYADSTPDVSLTYTDRNELHTMTDGFGVTTFAYTPSGLLDSEDGPGANDLVNYDYDSARRRSKLTLTQPTGSWVQDYAYDSASRLKTIVADSGTFTYHYPDGTGALSAASRAWKQLDLPGGHKIIHDHDSLGRLTQTELKNVSNVALNRHAYQFNARHQRTRQTFLNGNYMDYDYDNLGQLKLVDGRESGATVRLHEQLSYEYDEAWNLSERTQNQLTTTFGSNARNALTSSTRTGTGTVSGMASSATSSVTINGVAASVYSDQSYAREGVVLNDGLTEIRTSAVSTGAQTTADLKLLHTPVSLMPSYDAVGNLLSDGSRSFEYDSANRLVFYEEAEKVRIYFTYDGFGRLRQRNTSLWAAWFPGWQSVESVEFIYDGMNVIQERQLLSPHTPITTYTRGQDLSGSFGGAGGIGGLLAYTDHTSSSDRTAFYHADGNGNITAMINQHGLVVARYHYDPYGRMLGMTGPLAQQNRYRFSSKESQPFSELYYYGFRFYDPSLQRWINQDPIEEVGGLNLYGFVHNDPVNVIDSLGLAGTHPGVHLHRETMKFLLEEAMEAAAAELGIPVPQLVNSKKLWDRLIRWELLDPKQWDLSEFHKLIRSAKRSKKCPDQTLYDILKARDRGDLHNKKEKIIKPFRKLMKGRTNPDIFFDEKGRVVLRTRDGKTTIPTGKTMDEILPDLFK